MSLIDFKNNMIMDIHNHNHDKIDECIKNNIFKLSKNNLLYFELEPKYNKYPDKTLLFVHGLQNIYDVYTHMLEANLNIRVLSFQYYGYYMSNSGSPNLTEENYMKTMKELTRLIKGDYIVIGYSLGTYGACFFNKKHIGQICPLTSLSMNSYNLYTGNSFNVEEIISKERKKKFIMVSFYFDFLTVPEIFKYKKYKNCEINLTIGDHFSYYHVINWLVDRLISFD